MTSADDFFGSFEGSGSWHDAAGTSAAYRIRQTILSTPDGFEVAFRHEFDGGSVVEARYAMTWISGNLFRVSVADDVVGNGYVFGGFCHYHLKKGLAFVEASYRLADDGLAVFGSSSTNAAGNYVAWQESLHRT